MNEFWNKVFEQNKAKEILNSFYQARRVPHAFIFSGSSGVGKYFLALQYAKLLYSQYDEKTKILAVKKISNLQEPFIKLVFPLPRGRGESAEDSAIEKLTNDQLELIHEQIQKKIINPYYQIYLKDSFTIKINSIRDIKKYINICYEDVPLRFIMILHSDLMNEQTQNALLKNLEEPPEGIIFFIITTNKEKLLPTIQSRCWLIDFEPLSKDSVKEILIEKFMVGNELADKVSHFSEGSLLVANDLLNRNFEELLEIVISILRYSLAKRYYSAYKEFSSAFNNKSKEELRIVIKLIKIWIYDVIKNRYSIPNYYLTDYKETFEKFNQKYGNANVSDIFNKLDQLEDYADKNLNLNVLTLNLIFEIASLAMRK